MKATRTTNPLHFEDLEPHRFEDLIRQLIHDFRSWTMLEATGRSGSDSGVDILGLERLVPEVDSDEVGEAEEQVPVLRKWVIQCKREKTITPAKVTRYVRESLANNADAYGVILAAACDFSLKARQVFRSAVAEFGVAEAHIWGKAELEDLLFLPHNDRLLFGYFGISLHIRRRSLQSEVTTHLALKRKLVKVVPLGERTYRHVLLRDPADARYPYIKDVNTFRCSPPWLYIEPLGHLPLNHLQFVVRNTPGWYDPQTGEWDIPRRWQLMPANDHLFGLPRDLWQLEHAETEELMKKVPDEKRATIQVTRFISYSRIIAVDEIGDAYNEGPHILVARHPSGDGLFEPDWALVTVMNHDTPEIDLDVAKQIDIFPIPPEAG